MATKTINRREFIKALSIGLAGGYIGLKTGNSIAGGMGGSGGGGGCGCGGGTSIIDPPPGAAFADPSILHNESTESGVVEVSIEAKVSPININDTMANLLTYNRYYPAPTINVHRGDLLRVNLKNSLSMLGTNILDHDRDITNLHTHGLHVSPSGNSDNMMVMLMSDDTFTYEYDLSLQEPMAVRINPAPAKTEQIYLSMGQMKGYINGISFEMLSDGTMKAAEIHSMLGTYEVWEIINQSGMDHPFHQHVNPCQVLSITSGDSGYASFYTTAPAWKDVVLIPKKGSAKILVPVKDYDGMSMFHCHIVEHEDIGMMGLWHIMGMM